MRSSIHAKALEIPFGRKACFSRKIISSSAPFTSFPKFENFWLLQNGFLLQAICLFILKKKTFRTKVVILIAFYCLFTAFSQLCNRTPVVFEKLLFPAKRSHFVRISNKYYFSWYFANLKTSIWQAMVMKTHAYTLWSSFHVWARTEYKNWKTLQR